MNGEPFARIDLKNLISNAEILKQACAPAKFCAVVKADAYGHGAAEVARAVDGIADAFAVGSVSEGVALRIAGVRAPVLCLIPTCDFARAARYGIQISLHSIGALADFAEYAKTHNFPNFQLAVNSGMNRLGVDLREISDCLKILRDCSVLTKSKAFKGAYSHFYDVCDYLACLRQFYAFCDFAKVLREKADFDFLHIASSGALSYGERFKLDFVRSGLALYGYAPNLCLAGLKPVMSVHADILQRRKINRGEALLYGAEGASKNLVADVLGYGYFHGLKRGLKGQLKSACMNICAVEMAEGRGDGPSFSRESAFTGEMAEGTACVFSNAAEAAEKAGISVYEVLVSARSLKKIYVK